MPIYDIVKEKAQSAHDASRLLATTNTGVKNRALLAMADALLAQADFVLQANEKDMEHARSIGMKSSLQDRLRLTQERIQSMAEGLRLVAALKDPVG